MTINKKPRSCTAIDVKIGGKIRVQRTALDLTQGGLAKRIGVTMQQLQKYESGTNRLSVTRLLRLCDALEVPFSFFIGDDATVNAEPTLEYSAETRKLVILYNKIRRPVLKNRLLELAEALAEETEVD